MSSLAGLPDLVGFFSYSRRDDEHSGGALSRLRARIHSELRMQLGRDVRLWQDTAAIPHGTLWEDQIRAAIEESAFFIPIVTPSAVASEHCRFEFHSFVERETALGRTDLVFPILYIKVPALSDEAELRENGVLRMIHSRQYADWTKIRLQDIGSFEVGTQVERLCEDIVHALRQASAPADRSRERRPVAAAARAPPGDWGQAETQAEWARAGAEPTRWQAPVSRGPSGEASHDSNAAEVARAFAGARRADTVLGIDMFLAAHPHSHIEGAAQALRAALVARDHAYDSAIAKGDRAALRGFLRAYASGVQADDIRRRLRALGWRRWRTSTIVIVGVCALVALLLVGLVIWAVVADDDQETCANQSGPTAIEACTRVIVDSTNTESERAEAYNSRGVEYFNTRDYDSAIADYSQAIRLDPNFALAFRNRGNAYEDKKDYDHALADFTTAVQLNPKDAAAYGQRGLVYLARKDYDRAIADFNNAIRFDPKNAAAYYNRGLAKKAKGDTTGGDADIATARRLKPTVGD